MSLITAAPHRSSGGWRASCQPCHGHCLGKHHWRDQPLGVAGHGVHHHPHSRSSWVEINYAFSSQKAVISCRAGVGISAAPPALPRSLPLLLLPGRNSQLGFCHQRTHVLREVSISVNNNFSSSSPRHRPPPCSGSPDERRWHAWKLQLTPACQPGPEPLASPQLTASCRGSNRVGSIP